MVGVRRVKNRIKVQPVVALSDQEIEDYLEDALERDPYVERHQITPTVINGTAYLYGTVDSNFEKAQAGDVAARVASVEEVENNLTVSGPDEAYAYEPYVDGWYLPEYDWYEYTPGSTYESDAEIKNDIEDQLFWSPFVDSADVNVTVDDGVARLTGSMDSTSEYNAAEENAYEGGATWVNNDLVVR